MKWHSLVPQADSFSAIIVTIRSHGKRTAGHMSRNLLLMPVDILRFPLVFANKSRSAAYGAGAEVIEHRPTPGSSNANANSTSSSTAVSDSATEMRALQRATTASS